jgi:hypothetical protein
VSHDIVKRKEGERLIDRWAIGNFIDWAAGRRGNEATKQAMRADLDEVTAGFAGPNPTAVEMVLAQTAAILWFVLRMHEAQYVSCSRTEEGMTIVQSEHHQHRIDRTHRRLMSTIKTLATVRRLAVPAVQINVARQQVNRLNVGEPGEPKGPRADSVNQ